MELILINSGKLKIMMTREDMAQYDLRCESMDYDNAETRHALWSLLDEAKHRTGFDAAKERVFIQLYPSKGGGCEMYITKMGEKESPGSSGPFRKVEGGMTRTGIYSFERFDWLAAACRGLFLSGNRVESSAYYDKEKRVYYLVLSEPKKPPSARRDAWVFIGEFGRSENAAQTRLYIKERCVCICRENAVQTLSDM